MKVVGERERTGLTDQYSFPLQQEDAATAEVSRSQLWQWVRHGTSTAEGTRIDKALILGLLDKQTESLIKGAPADNKFRFTADSLRPYITGEEYLDFIPEYVPNPPFFLPYLSTRPSLFLGCPIIHVADRFPGFSTLMLRPRKLNGRGRKTG